MGLSLSSFSADWNFRMDALLPPDMAKKAEDVGVRKAGMDALSMFTLAILAGAFIALGAVFATTAAAGTAGAVPYGVQRLIVGTVFSLGLILVVVGGAELLPETVWSLWPGRVAAFRWLPCCGTGRSCLPGTLSGRLESRGLVYFSGHHEFGSGSVGLTALKIAQSKMHFGFLQAVCLGILCNLLVCLAVLVTFIYLRTDVSVTPQ